VSSILKQVEQASDFSLLSTELNSLANNTNCTPSSALNNIQGESGKEGYPRGKVELLLAAYSGTPTANTGVSVWFLRAPDGTNYEDGSSSVTPARPPDVFIPVRAVASGPQRVVKECWFPVGLFKALARNEGTGISFASSGNTLRAKLSSEEV
jgi:hypothetical protein